MTAFSSTGLESGISNSLHFQTEASTPALSFSGLTPTTISTNTAPHDANLSAAGANFLNVNRVTFTWSGADNGSTVWDRGGTDWNNKVTVNSDSSMSLRPRVIETSPTWSGTLNWTVTLRDTSGATASRTFTVTYNPVTTLSFSALTPATISTNAAPYDANLSAAGANFLNVNRVTFTWSGADSGSATWDRGGSDWNDKVTVNSDSSMSLRPRVIETSPTWSGTLNWTVTLRDTSGATASRTFTVTYNPVATLTVIAPSGGGTIQAGTPLSISWAVNGDPSAFSFFFVEYSLNGGNTWSFIDNGYITGSGRTATWLIPANTSSSQSRIRIRAFNSAGHLIAVATSGNLFTIIPTGTRPVARPDCNNNAPSYGQSVRFSGANSYAASGRSIVSYFWNFGDGSTATGMAPTHSFAPTGTQTFPVTLTVTDSEGAVSFPKTLNVTVTGQALGADNLQSKFADPVNLATGNFLYDHVDLTIDGIGFPFSFQRFYNSKGAGIASSPMGVNWSHSYNIQMIHSNGIARIIYGDGRSEIFAYTNGVYVAEAGIHNKLKSNANGTLTLSTKDKLHHHFDLAGRLASITDKNSNTLSLAYDDAGTLAVITNSAGRVITFTHDDSNRIVNIVDPLSRTNSYAYSPEGNLISHTNPRGGTTQYGYDDDHQMTYAIDPNGNQFVQNVYNFNRVVEAQRDALGNLSTFIYDFVTRETEVINPYGYSQFHKHDDKLRVIQIIDEVGNVENFEYDEFNNRTKVVDKNRRVTTYTYDANGNVTSKTAPPAQGHLVGSLTTISYDAQSNPTNRVDAKLGVTSFRYDERGNLTETVNARNATNSITYDMRGLPLIIKDFNGNIQSNTFDAAGNLLSTHDALGYVRYYTYDEIGRKTSAVNPNNATNRFVYDGNNNLVAAIDPLGFTNSFAYDPNNNQIWSQDPLGNKTTHVYDEKDRLIMVSNAVGGVTHHSYNALDQRISTTDSRGGTTQYVYDPVGNLVTISNALGHATQYTYDPNGNRLSAINPLGQVSTNAYDALDRLITTTDPMGYSMQYTYDKLGRRTHTSDQNGQVTQFSYDVQGRLTNVVDAAGGVVHFSYDLVGNRTEMQEPNGSITTYTYDVLNRLIQKNEPIGSYQYGYDGTGSLTTRTDANGHTVTNVYDANQRLVAVRYPDGSQASFTYDAAGNRVSMSDSNGITTLAYDARNRMTNYTDSAGQTVTYAYDTNGNRTSITYPGGKTVNYTYDALNRLVAVTDWLGGTTTYTYDAAGNLIHSHNPNGTTASYGFDAARRLTSLTNALPDASVLSAYTLTLDGVGNHIQSQQIDTLAPIIPTQTVNYAYDVDSRLTNAAGAAISYDLNGNMIARGEDTFTYNYENLLVQANIDGVSYQYQYDGLGNRLSATRAGDTTRFILDVTGSLTHVLAESDGNGTISAYYVYGLGLVARITADDEPYYYHYDVRGSTVALTDANGNITDKYAYDPFGILANSEESTTNPFKYVGRFGVMDENNGLASIRARYYNPELGRFITKDPFTGTDDNTQSLNRFIYSQNNPVRLGCDFNSLIGVMLLSAGWQGWH